MVDATRGFDVLLDLGSAVLLPEVFLKAINIARHIRGGDGRARRIVTANVDMLQHNRPAQNVVSRPTLPDGKGYQITRHHELLFPLRYAMVRARTS